MSRFWYIRSARTVALLLIALLVLSVSIAALVLCQVRLSSGAWPEWITGFLGAVKGMTWSDAGLLGAAIGSVIVGLLLLGAAVIPGKRKTALLDWDSQELSEEWTMDPRGLSNLARYEAERTDGVHKASVSFRAQELKIHVSTPVHEVAEVKNSVQEHVKAALAAIPLSREVKVSARVLMKGER
ncbi:DUF6286 domain-containing protein [Glutamicibacter sp.]|uniref:DUF6286 domain-containing protein n=1 Tax=Glutamicibacter sp. TaxID=1931995 RepID=UPI002B486B33|nr:DUF6286 domain-containing protein [Glutamicibacter sp.]HJX76698.1 DUF6286 domain-containing protein [Glutamicibacter sp.]